MKPNYFTIHKNKFPKRLRRNNPKKRLAMILSIDRKTELKHDTLRFFRVNIFIWVLFAILNALTSCSSESYVDPEEIIDTPVQEMLLGTYKHHSGELNTGTVTVYPYRVIINTLDYKVDVDLKNNSTYYSISPNYYIEVLLKDKRTLKIDFLPSIERLSLYIIEKDVKMTYYGTFDKIKND